MKKTAQEFALLLTLVAFTFSSTQHFRFAQANPSIPITPYDPPDIELPPPIIAVQSPENGSLVNTNFVSIAFNVTVPASSIPYDKPIWWTYYTADWRQGTFLVFQQDVSSDGHLSFKSFNVTLTDIPEGKHFVEIYARRIITVEQHYTFDANSQVLLNFVVDCSAPRISSLSVENKSYASPDLPLSFIVNEEFSQASYSLDNQAETVFDGNTTITRLNGGSHTLTVFVVDLAGNVAASEIISFSVEAPFPALHFVAPFAVALTIGTVGVLAQWKKRKREASSS